MFGYRLRWRETHLHLRGKNNRFSQRDVLGAGEMCYGNELEELCCNAPCLNP